MTVRVFPMSQPFEREMKRAKRVADPQTLRVSEVCDDLASKVTNGDRDDFSRNSPEQFYRLRESKPFSPLAAIPQGVLTSDKDVTPQILAHWESVLREDTFKNRAQYYVEGAHRWWDEAQEAEGLRKSGQSARATEADLSHGSFQDLAKWDNIKRVLKCSPYGAELLRQFEAYKGVKIGFGNDLGCAASFWFPPPLVILRHSAPDAEAAISFAHEVTHVLSAIKGKTPLILDTTREEYASAMVSGEKDAYASQWKVARELLHSGSERVREIAAWDTELQTYLRLAYGVGAGECPQSLGTQNMEHLITWS